MNSGGPGAGIAECLVHREGHWRWKEGHELKPGVGTRDRCRGGAGWSWHGGVCCRFLKEGLLRLPLEKQGALDWSKLVRDPAWGGRALLEGPPWTWRAEFAFSGSPAHGWTCRRYQNFSCRMPLRKGHLSGSLLGDENRSPWWGAGRKRGAPPAFRLPGCLSP
jgi:hypothetical protein